MEVLRFIEHFREAREVFLHGMCYWFAVILRDRFDGLIFYLPVENHFVTWIDGSFYDARGPVEPDEAPVLWDVYAKRDPKHTARIVKDCILKEEDYE